MYEPRRDPRTLTKLSEVLAALTSLESEETENSRTLTELLNAKEPVVESLARLDSLRPHIDTLQQDASLLREQVSKTAKTAERVGSSVRSLDEEIKRVREAADRVGQVMELKASLTDLQSSIERQDWESASRHCARAMALPTEVVSGRFAETTVPTSESHLPPSQTLQLARETLLKTFLQNFEQASRSRDAAATTRFFKLFPSVGWEEEGLNAYAEFVVDLVLVKAPSTAKTSSPLYFTTSLTAFFEGVAMIVDQHRPVVEKYYGPGKMQPVIQRLLRESDRVTKNLIDTWEEERDVKRKLADVKNYSPIATVGRNAQRAPINAPIEEEIDLREIDKLTSELSGMIGRWYLFRRFLIEYTNDEGNEDAEEQAPKPAEMMKEMTQSLDSTESRKLFEELAKSYYAPLEIWYTRISIDKVHRLSDIDTSQQPPTSTTPDDAFYIFKMVFLRILSTGSTNIVDLCLKQLREVMETDFIGVLRKKLDDIYRPGTGSGRNEKEQRIAFIVILNDLDTSSSHLDRLLQDLGESPPIDQYYLADVQKDIKTQLQSFSSLSSKFRSTLRAGIEQIFNQLLRPKLRTFMPDVYKDTNYLLDEDAYTQAEYQDIIRKRFIKTWEGLVDGYKDAFTDRNYRTFFGLALDFVLRPWEKLVVTMRFTELGAIRFDRDLRAITSYLASQTAFGDAREKFVRLQQVSTLLNLDADEDVDEFYNSSGITWKLSNTEARAIASLKI